MAVFFCALPCDEWQKCHEAGAFDGLCELALMLGTDAGTLAGDHASVRGQVLFQDLAILIVDQLYIVR